MMSQEECQDQDRFHDSFDRLPSSASSNTSCSSSPSPAQVDHHCHPCFTHCNDNPDPDDSPVPKFPIAFSQNYDLWTSRPTSVEERRIRLLRHTGLARDPSLLRHRSSLSFSLSCFPNDDGDGDHLKMLDSHCLNDDSCCHLNGRRAFRSKSYGHCNSPRTLEAHSDYLPVGLDDVNNGNSCNIQSNCCKSPVIGGAVSPNKPPQVKIKLDRNGLSPVARNEDSECDGVNNAVCMIKNLDNGKEFMVNEVREDGTWQKIKEVGTGRQLTMEEFSSEMCIGTSPIVQELMRRQNVEDRNKEGLDSNPDGRSKMKKRGSWLKSIKNVASYVKGGHKERRRISDERHTSFEKGGRRSNSGTDGSWRDGNSFHGPERVRVRQYGKFVKELTALYKRQQIQAHKGSIWAMRFSLDGKYLASAGEDCMIHVWQVVETERKGDLFFDKFEDGNFNLLFLADELPEPEPTSMTPNLGGRLEKKRRGRSSLSRKSLNLEQILVPDTVFALSEKSICSFQGHLDDVLDLSWSKSQQLLSSSMDKTVRLWDLSSKSCLKIFSHSDYVTCIQFNPVDDRYFISGSLDAKVRIWSIPDRKVVDWNDLHEMVTAACYTPDGQGALVGSYKGSCCLYDTSENKLLQKNQIDLQNKKKKPRQKKITGFQFAPGSTSEVLITTADSRIRVIDGVNVVHKFKGFRNTNSQISASLTFNGKYVLSASEDSYVYIWNHEVESRPNRSTKGITSSQSYELFHCRDVSVVIPWPGSQNAAMDLFEETHGSDGRSLPSGCCETGNCLLDKISFSGTWPEERFVSVSKKHGNPRVSVSADYSNGLYQSRPAWGLVIVTASLGGEIATFQNFGLPV